MILGLEIALAVIGVMALIRGKMTLSKAKVVHGIPARLLGLLALTPLPVVLVVGVGYVALSDPKDPEQFAEDNKWTLIAIEAGVVIAIAALVAVIGFSFATDPEEPPRRRVRDDYDDEYEDDDRPRRKTRAGRDDPDDEYDDRPRRRRDDNWEDEDYDRPRPR
jgi:hypothetical protein